jgi:hypothetical protein
LNGRKDTTFRMKEEIHHLDGKKRNNIFRTRIKVQFLEQKKVQRLEWKKIYNI